MIVSSGRHFLFRFYLAEIENITPLATALAKNGSIGTPNATSPQSVRRGRP
jgi:hypothetical protein